MKVISVKAIAASMIATIAVTSLAAPGFAASRAYCDGYARHVANHHANGGDILAGTVLGIGAGVLLGAAIGGHNAVRNGALIGGIGGTAVGAAATESRWHRIYQQAFADCRANM